MRNSIHSTMMMVLHTVIRATAAGRPGRAASSLRRKPPREAPRLLASTLAVMAYHHCGRGADANQVVRRIVEDHAHRKALGDNHPFEPIVHSRQARGAAVGRL